MRIGIDFDNTIVSYDALFYKVAREQDCVSPDTPANKLAVRDHLRRIGHEDRWTEMQGYVYGLRMEEALAYEGVIDFIGLATAAGHEISIVSHKTIHPYRGPQYDLHAAARGWIEHHLVKDGKTLLPAESIYFELTKQAKLARIADCRCDAFIDDLPEILLDKAFPVSTTPWLFDPDHYHSIYTNEGLQVFGSWLQLVKRFCT